MPFLEVSLRARSAARRAPPPEIKARIFLERGKGTHPRGRKPQQFRGTALVDQLIEAAQAQTGHQTQGKTGIGCFFHITHYNVRTLESTKLSFACFVPRQAGGTAVASLLL